jgi:hypothetical protein
VRQLQWTVAELSATVAELSKDVRSFLEWQRGEAERREDERYERRIIRRARQRADTLRSLALDAIPIVIGEEWATPDARTTAEQESVEWKVGDDLSEGFKSIRRLPDEEGEPAHESR